MVQEAEKYKAEDDVQRQKVSAKNGLESYAFNMKSAVEDEKLKGKISDEDKQKILDKCNEVISWLDRNQVWVCAELWLETLKTNAQNKLAFDSLLLLLYRRQKKMSLNISRKSWRSCATPSWPSCTKVQVGFQGACPAASPGVVLLLEEEDPPAPPSRRSTKPQLEQMCMSLFPLFLKRSCESNTIHVIAVLCKYSKPLTSILCWLFWLFSSSFFFNFVLYARLKAVSALWLYWLTVSLGSEVPLSLVHICIPSVFLGWYMKLKLLFIAQRLAKLNQMKYFHDFRVIYLLPQRFSVKLSSTMECFLRHGFQPARLNLKLHQSRWLSRHACSFSRLPLCFCG